MSKSLQKVPVLKEKSFFLFYLNQIYLKPWDSNAIFSMITIFKYMYTIFIIFFVPVTAIKLETTWNLS